MRQMAVGPDENLSLKMIGLAAAAVFANDKLVEFFDTGNEMAMPMRMRVRVGIMLSMQVSGTVELAPTVAKE